MDSSTPTPETSENVFSLYLFHLFSLEYVFMYSISLVQSGNHNFLECSEKLNLNQKMCARVIQKKIKSSLKEYVGNALEILTNEKHFPKVISQ